MSRIEESDYETRDLGEALLAFARAVEKLAPESLDPAIAATYEVLDREKQNNPTADLRLGYEFLELAQGPSNFLRHPPPDAH